MKLQKEVYENWSFEELATSGLFSTRLLETIEGSVLGDATLAFTGKQARLRIGRAGGHLDVLKALWKVLVELEQDLREPYLGTVGEARLDTHVHPLYTWFFYRWYYLMYDYKARLGLSYRFRVPPEKGECWKVLPEDVAITPTVLFWEHFFDGSLYWKKNGHGSGHSPSVYLSTHNFTFDETDCLNKRITEKAGLPFKTYKQVNKGKVYPVSYLLSGKANAPSYFDYIGASGFPYPDSYRHRVQGFESCFVQNIHSSKT